MSQISLNKIISSVALASLLAGCAGGMIPNNQPQPPAWYFDNKQNNQVFMYGVGEGSTLEDSKAMALSAISSSIIVSVSGEMTKTTKSSGDFYSNSVKNDLKVELSKITFPNPIIEKKEVLGGKFYLLVKVNKTELFETILKELDVADSAMKTKYEQLAPVSSKLERIYGLKQLTQGIKGATNKANILSSLSKDFDLKSYIERYEQYKTELDNLKNSLNIVVSGTESSFNDSVTSLLNANGFRANQNSVDVKIETVNNTRYSEAQGWKIAKVTSTVKIYANTKILNSFSIESVGRSSSNNENALADATRSFKTSLEKKGIDSLLFAQ